MATAKCTHHFAPYTIILTDGCGWLNCVRRNDWSKDSAAYKSMKKSRVHRNLAMVYVSPQLATVFPAKIANLGKIFPPPPPFKNYMVYIYNRVCHALINFFLLPQRVAYISSGVNSTRNFLTIYVYTSSIFEQAHTYFHSVYCQSNKCSSSCSIQKGMLKG